MTARILYRPPPAYSPEEPLPGASAANAGIPPVSRRARLLDTALHHLADIRYWSLPLLALMIGAVYGLVYWTGGIKYVYSHSMYLPVLLGGLVLGARGGIATGLIAGLVLGPAMPIDTLTGEPQQALNWLYRTGYFALIGFLAGLGSDSTRHYLAHIRWVMRHDPVTGLQNRQALTEDLNGGGRPSPHGALAVISIDNAAEMEAAYGPDISDAIIGQLAERLDSILSPDSGRYRSSSHQLAVLLPAGQRQLIRCKIGEMTELFVRPFSFGGISLHGDIRLGYVALSQLQETPEHYLRRAEIALQSASESARRWVEFAPALDSRQVRENLELLGELKAALANGQLELHYQPKVCIATGRIIGAEALMRWHHPRRGMIPPGKFIPRAEHSTLIELLTEWALNRALQQLVAWCDTGMDINVAVNVSARNLLQPGFVDDIVRLLQKHGVDGRRLELEVTEGAFMTDIERSILKLKQLAKTRVTLSIDDFGTGYSSLQYLNELPASLIKIDRAFIDRLAPDSRAAHIVTAAIDMAHGLEMQVVAEGVEQPDSYRYLADIGCDIAQGYLIAKPMPAEDFTRWYRERNGVYRLE